MSCPQCEATTRAGTRCKRLTCKYAPFCVSHKAFYVAQSTIPGAGRGGFAARALQRGDTIGNYIVATVRQSRDEFIEQHPDGRATHTARIGDHYYTALGTGRGTQNAIGMLNRAPRGGRNNARILASGRVVASQRIPMDREIFLAYGGSYRI